MPQTSVLCDVHDVMRPAADLVLLSFGSAHREDAAPPILWLTSGTNSTVKSQAIERSFCVGASLALIAFCFCWLA